MGLFLQYRLKYTGKSWEIQGNIPTNLIFYMRVIKLQQIELGSYPLVGKQFQHIQAEKFSFLSLQIKYLSPFREKFIKL